MSKKQLYSLRGVFSVLTVFAVVLSPVQPSLALGVVFAQEDIDTEENDIAIPEPAIDLSNNDLTLNIHLLPGHEEDKENKEEEQAQQPQDDENELEENSKNLTQNTRNNLAVVNEVDTGDEVEKVEICHIPPSGESPYTIEVVVGSPSVDDHLEHGDYLGPCEDLNNDEGEDEGDDSFVPHLPDRCSGTIEDYNLIVGTNDADIIEGTAGNDLIISLDGNDIVHAGEGDDCIDSGKGNDIVHAGEGNDVVETGWGSDIANGNEGDDFLKTGNGNDIIDGGPDTDTCLPGPGNDIVKNCENVDDPDDGEEPGDGEEPEEPTDPEPAAILGIKFNDENGNGVFDQDETGLSGWTISLVGTTTGATSTSVSTSTDQNGEYVFSSLDAGTYQICEEVQENWEQTHPATSTPESFECSDSTTGYEITLTEDEVREDINFGNTQTATTTPPDNGTPPAGGGGGGGGSSSGGGGISPAFSLACVVSPSTASVGQNVVFAAGQTGAVAPVTFVWSGDIAGSGVSVNSVFASAGTKTATVTATDADGDAVSVDCSVDIVGSGAPSLGVGGAPGGEVIVPPGQIGQEDSLAQNGLLVDQEDLGDGSEVVEEERRGFFAAIASAGLGTIILWILIALIIIGLLLFFFLWRKRDEEEGGKGGPKRPGQSGGGQKPPQPPQKPPVIPLAAKREEKEQKTGEA